MILFIIGLLIGLTAGAVSGVFLHILLENTKEMEDDS